MGIVFRQSAKNVVVTGMGAVLGALTVWLSTEYLSKREYGFVSNFTNYAVILSQLLLLGINYTLAVYIHKYATDPARRKLLLTWSLILPTIVWVVFFISYMFLRSWILPHFQLEDQPFMAQYFVWLPIFSLLFIYLMVLEQYLGSQMKVAISAFMREVVLRIANIGLILLFVNGVVGFNVLVTGIVLTYLLPVSILLFLAWRTEAFGLSLQFGSFSKAEYKEILSFTWYHFLLTASVLLIGRMDILLLPFYDHAGFSAGAVYTVSLFLISLLSVPFKGMLTASFTVLAKAFADKDLEKARSLFLRSSVNILIATVCLALILCCNLQNIVKIIGEGYGEIIPVFLILFTGNMINIATGMNDQVLSITNYYKFNFYLSLLLIVVLFALIRVLVPQFGVLGAAWSTTITMAVFNLVKTVFVWNKLQMLPFSKSTLLVLVAGLPALAAGYFLPNFFGFLSNVYVHTFIDASVRSLAIVIVYFLMLLWLKPSKDLEEYLAAIKKNKRLF